jgi:hypothetical protein
MKNAGEVDRPEEERIKTSHGARMLDSSGRRSEETILIAGIENRTGDFAEATRTTTDLDHDRQNVKIALRKRQARSTNRKNRTRRRRKRKRLPQQYLKSR